MSTNMASIVFACLLLFGLTDLSQASITTHPSNVTICIGGKAVFTCEVDRIGSTNNVMWQQLRSDGLKFNTIHDKLGDFSITVNMNGDMPSSTLTISGATDSNVKGTSMYRCAVNDVKSMNASIHILDLPGIPMNIRVNDINSTSFVVQWDEVDDVGNYSVDWKDDGGMIGETKTSQTSITITQLTPNTTYNVTVTAGNICGFGTVSDILIATTNVTLLIVPSVSSVMTITSTIAIPIPPPTPSATGNSSGSSDSAGAGGSGGGGAGGIIGGVVGGIIAVVLVIIIIVVLYWFCVYKKKGGTDLEKETYATLQSPTGSFAKDTFPESHYDAVDTPGTIVIPHQSTSGVEYAVSTKTASMASLNEPPPEYAYAAVDKKMHVASNIPHQSSAAGVQYAVSTKAAEAKEPHRYDEIRDEPGNVPHHTSTTGAVYAVSAKATAHQYDDVKDKSPQGISYAEIQHGSTSGVKVAIGDDPVVKYTQVS